MTKRFGDKSRKHRPLKDVVVDVPDQFRATDWMRDLRRRYEIQEEPAVHVAAVFLDTFDGRLFDKGLACSSSTGIVRLYSVDNPSKEAQVAIDPPPRFAAEFPEGKLKERLLPVSRNRALLKVLSLSIARQSWRILNADQKTVARMVLEEAEVRDETQSAQLRPCLILKPVRGYERLAGEMAEWFEESGLNRLDRPVYWQALDALHRTPKQHLPSSGTRLMGSMPGADAVRSLLESLYETMRINEAGVLGDTDTEFLHDYRVAVRKARSLVAQTKGVFAPGPTARFRKSLSWLGKATNTLRDLDVYLLQRSKYQGLLCPPLNAHIEPFFVFLRGEREKTFQAFVRVMNSREYTDVVLGWGALVKDPARLGLGRKAMVPVEQLARSRIAKSCRTVLERGYELTDGTTPRALHALRIECKRVRYLMELFAALVPEAKDLTRRMKKLQDSLGSIQDLTVQEARLRQYLTQPEICQEGSKTAMATQELISCVCEERELEQKRVLKLFGQFNDSLGETDPPYSLLLPWLRVR